MDDKTYILKEKRFKQIEIEVDNMDEDKTVFFLVPESNEEEYMLLLQKWLYAFRFSIKEILEEAKERELELFYMCTMYDDRVVSEV